MKRIDSDGGVKKLASTLNVIPAKAGMTEYLTIYEIINFENNPSAYSECSPYSCIKFSIILIGGALLLQATSIVEKLWNPPMVNSRKLL